MNTTRIDLLREESGSHEWAPRELQALLQQQVLKVPAAYRDTVKVRFEATPDYDDYTCVFEVWYERPETPEEAAAAQAKQQEENREYVEALERQLNAARRRLSL